MTKISGRSFFVGVATTFIILGVGFGGGLMMAKNVSQPPSARSSRSTVAALPPVRVILPSTTEAAALPQPLAANTQVTDSAPAPVTPSSQQPIPEVASNDSPQRSGRAMADERTERRQADVEERQRRKKLAERRVRREASRIAKTQQGDRQPRIMAFDGDVEQPRWSGGIIGQ